jgi:hypothetical protein
MKRGIADRNEVALHLEDREAEPLPPKIDIESLAHGIAARLNTRSKARLLRNVSPPPHNLSRGKVAFSIKQTDLPAAASVQAAADPAGPAPTTTASYVSALMRLSRRRRRSRQKSYARRTTKIEFQDLCSSIFGSLIGLRVSYALAPRSTMSSRYFAATICKPTGRPEDVNPQGMDAAGCCVRLKG